MLGPAWRGNRMLLGDRVRWRDVEVAESADGGALLVAVLREGRTTLLGLGAPAAAVALVRGHVDRRLSEGAPAHVGWMSVPRDAVVGEELLGVLGLQPYSTWDWMATSTAPPSASGEERVLRLDPRVDAAAIRDCLAVANPGTTADPTAGSEAAWVGIPGDDGLDGVFGASLRGGPAGGGFSWHLHGLAVRPDARGSGLGAALTAAITRAGLAAGAAWVSLGMYADNEHARRIYERLGFVTEAAFASYGPLGVRRPAT